MHSLKPIKRIEPQRHEGHKGLYLYFLLSLCVPRQRHCVFVVHKIVYYFALLASSRFKHAFLIFLLPATYYISSLQLTPQ